MEAELALVPANLSIPCLLTEKKLVSHTALRDQVLLEAGDVVATNNANAKSSLSQPASLSDFPTEACLYQYFGSTATR